MTRPLSHRVSKPLSRLYRTGALGEEELKAALGIEAAVVAIMTGGVRSGLARGERVNCARGQGFEARLAGALEARRLYFTWLDYMKHNRLPAGPVLEIVIEGKALRAVDRDWRRRKGWALSHLKRALGLYRTLSLRAARRKTA